MNAGQLAALIAAGFFAVLACVAMFVLLRLARLMSAVTGMVTEYRARADQLIEQAQAAVDRTNEQLIRTDAITASMDQVTANMAELSGHVSALAGLARGISTAVSAPLSGMSALLFGVRRAVLVRRSLEAAAAAAEHPAERLPGTQPAAITGTITTVSERAVGARFGGVVPPQRHSGERRHGDAKGPGSDDPPRFLAAGRGGRRRRRLPEGQQAGAHDHRLPGEHRAREWLSPGRCAAGTRPAGLAAGGRATAREVPLAGRGEWARSAVSFVSDVREGMADYRELQDGRRGRSLGSLADAAEPERGQRGRSEA